MSESIDYTFYRGRVGLYALLRALGAGPGDEVISQAFTCLAVPEGIQAAGAVPRFVDIEPDGFNIDPAKLEAALTPRTKAVVVQHTFGIPAQLGPITRILGRAGVALIEDCCHSLRSRYDGRVVGSFGVGGFYSYEWGKPVIAGLGGSVMVNDAALDRQLAAMYGEFRSPNALRQLRVEAQYLAHSLLYRPSTYWHLKRLFHALSRVGAAEGNFHDVQVDADAAIDFQLRMASRLRRRVARKMRALDQDTAHARQLAGQYRAAITGRSARHPQPDASADTVYVRYPLRVDAKEDILASAREANVELSDWYRTPVDPLPRDEWHLVGYEPGSCPEAEQRATEVVSLPINRRVGSRYVDRVAALLS